MSDSNLRVNLFYLNNGYYLSKNDPLFWRKLLQRQADNEEAMFHVGMAAELEAKKYLETFYTTRINKYLVYYRKTIVKAHNLVKKSFNKGFVPARIEALRIEREMQIEENKISEITSPKTFSKQQIILLFVAAVILSVLGALFFLPIDRLNTVNYSEHNYAFMLPYEVIESKPDKKVDIPNKQSVIVIPEKVQSREKIVNALVGRLKIEYEMDPRAAKQVVALDEKNNEIGMAIWEGGETNIQVYIYPTDGEVVMNNKEVQLWETTTVIRSALYQFINKNGYMPKDLQDLNQAYPDNYLSELPREPYKLKNAVTTSLTKDGGWLFSYEDYPSNKDLVSVVKDVLKPNLPYEREIPFTPLYVLIDKNKNMLSVISKDQIIRSYNVALGKDGITPEGNLFISKKVMNPDKRVPKADNVYGTRAMELSNMNYAIHGTNTPATIGQNISHGCIRLNNSDVEELYSMIPLNTTVEIAQKGSSIIPNEFDPFPASKGLYNNMDNSKEEDTSTNYHWAN